MHCWGSRVLGAAAGGLFLCLLLLLTKMGMLSCTATCLSLMDWQCSC